MEEAVFILIMAVIAAKTSGLLQFIFVLIFIIAVCCFVYISVFVSSSEQNEDLKLSEEEIRKKENKMDKKNDVNFKR